MRKLLPLVLLIPFALSGCNKKPQEEENNTKYEEPIYQEVEDLHIEFKDLFNQKEDKYYAYFYFVTCSWCSYLRPQITEIAKSGNPTIYFVFPSEELPYTDDLDLALSSQGKDKLEDVYLYSTPCLIEITNKIITMYTRDYYEIENFLNSVGK